MLVGQWLGRTLRRVALRTDAAFNPRVQMELPCDNVVVAPVAALVVYGQDQ